MEIRGIIHCHSTYSYDARLSLRELKELCQKNNVQFVCMTEHVDEMTDESARAFVKECEELSDASFIFIPGFEVGYLHAHVLMIGLREFFGNYAPNIEILRTWSKAASFVILAHPVRNHFDVDDGLLGELHGLEVWNQQYEGKRVPRTRSLTLLKHLRAQKPFLLGTGGVDFHRKEHMGPPFVTLTVGELTENAVLEKLKTGAYTVASPYASFSGTVPNIEKLKKDHQTASFFSVLVISVGKFVNKVFAGIGLSLPKSLKQAIRKHI